jgi:hypothetical protein
LEQKNTVPNTKKDQMLEHVLYQKTLPLQIRSSRSVKKNTLHKIRSLLKHLRHRIRRARMWNLHHKNDGSHTALTGK